MGSQKQREERRAVSLHARLRVDSGWHDVMIANVSSRGLLLRCPSPPPRSSVVEVRYRSFTIVGRIVWASNNRAGLRTQDKIDIPALLAQRAPAPRRPGEDRRAAPRNRLGTTRPSAAARAEASRRWARMFNWTMIAAGGMAAAGVVAASASAALRAPMERVGDVLAQQSAAASN